MTPQDLRELTARVEALVLPPQEPVDTIFGKIDDLATISEYANAPLTPFQKINMAYLNFQKCGIFKSALTKWDEADDDRKTWLTFKEHFHAAHKAMKRTGALTIQETFNRDTVANMVQEELHQVLVATQDPHFGSDNTSVEHLPTSSTSLPPSVTPTLASDISSALDLTLQTMQQQMAMMQQMMMHQLAFAQQPTSPATNTTTRKWNQQKYCWTHGACNHWSPECCTKAEGHKDSANFVNKQGGSTKNISG